MTTQTIRIVVDASQAQAGARVVIRSLDDIRGAAGRALDALVGIKGSTVALAGIGAAAAALAREIVRAGDAYTKMSGQIRAAVGDMAAAQRIMGELYKLNLQTGGSMEDAAGAFTRFAIASRQIGATNSEVLQLLGTVQKLGIVSGASTQEAASGATQLGQALASGVLQGDELKSILENMPALGEALAKSLGVSIGELRKMGAEGQLTSDKVFGALLKASEEANKKFAEMPITVERASGQMAVAWDGFLTKLDQSLGLSQKLSQVIHGIAMGLDGLSSRIAAEAPQQVLARLRKERTDRAAQAKEADTRGEIASMLAQGYLPTDPEIISRRGVLAGLDKLDAQIAAAEKLAAADRRLSENRAVLEDVTARTRKEEAQLAANQVASKKVTEELDKVEKARSKHRETIAQLDKLRNAPGGIDDARYAKLKALADKELADAFKGTNPEAEKFDKWLKDIIEKAERLKAQKLEDALKLVNKTIEDGLTPAEKYAKDARELNDALNLLAENGTTFSADQIASLNKALQDADPAFQELKKRAEEASAELGKIFERAFDRLGDSLVDAFVSGKDAAIDFGGVVKSIIASIIADLAKMAIAAPLKNAIFGTASATLWDLPMFGGGGAGVSPGSVQLQPNGQGGFSLVNTASSLAMKQAGSTLLDKGVSFLGLGDTWAGLMNTPIFGAGTAEIAATTAASPAIQTAMMAGDTYAAATGTMPTFTVGGAMAGVGGGFFGGAVGSMLGTATNSKAVGALSGAAAGAASAWAMGAMAGSAAGPIGMAIGALIGAIMGAIGTVKKATQYGGAWVRFDQNGKVIDRGQGAENGVNDEALRQRVDAVQGIIEAVTRGGNLKRPNDLWIGTEYHEDKGNTTVLNGWGAGRVEVSKAEDPAQIAIDVLKYMEKTGSLTGSNKDLLTAIRNTKSTTAEEISKDLDAANSFRPWFEAMREGGDALGLQIRTMMEAAQEAGRKAKEDIIDYRDRIIELGIETKENLTPAMKTSVEAMMGLGKEGDTLKGLAAVIKAAEINFESFKPILEELGYTAAEQATLLTRVLEQAATDYNKVVNEVVRQGNIVVAQALDPNYRIGAGDLLSNLNLDPAKFPAFTTAIDGFLTKAQAGTATAVDLRNAQAEVNQRWRNGRIDAQQYGQIVQFLSQAYRNGADAAQAQADAIRSQGASLTQEVETLWNSIVTEQRDAAAALVQSFTSIKDSLASYRKSLLLGEYSPLDPQAKFQTAQAEFRATLAKAKLGDVKAGESLQATADAYLKANREFWASSNPEAFQEVTQGLEAVETVAERQIRLSQAQVDRLDALISTTGRGLAGVELAMRDVLARGDYRDYGQNKGLNYLLAAALPNFKGSFGNGEFSAWVAQNLPNSNANFGKNADLNRLLSVLSGYTGNYGSGGGDWGAAFKSMAADDPRRVAARILVQNAGYTPGFAAGGDHLGGLRIVGERGPELEATGPARIWNAGQTAAMLRAANSNDANETAALLREVVQEIRTLVRVTAASGDGTHDRLEAIDGKLAEVERKSRLSNAA